MFEDEEGNFFGFNYNATVKEERGLLSSVIESINYMYENVIESYVEDIYTGVIEEYTLATVKVGCLSTRGHRNLTKIFSKCLNIFLVFQLIGWFFFASAILVKGAVINSFNDARDGGYGRGFGDTTNLAFISPLFKVDK